MASGKKDGSKELLKRAAKGWLDDGAEEAVSRPQAARQAAKSAKAPGRKKGSAGSPAASGRREKPGRVVALGVDVPRIAELAEAEAAKKAAESAKPDGYEFGRPTDYRPEYAAIAAAMCHMGAADFELAEEFGVSCFTIWKWRSKYEDFSNALSQGKDAFDERVERSLAMRAIGYSIHTEKVFNYEGSIVRADIVQHYPPDVGAIKMWLTNRKPEVWRDKSEVKLDDSGAFVKLWSAISDGTIGTLLKESA
jgi:hypothetical protein